MVGCSEHNDAAYGSIRFGKFLKYLVEDMFAYQDGFHSFELVWDASVIPQ